MIKVLVKTLGTLAAALLMLRPLWVDRGEGVIESVRSFGLAPASVVIAAFLAGVALYCVSLQRCLSSVHPARRAMKPGAVWLMYVPFFNIIEDFFIIDGVTRSLEAEASVNPALSGVRDFGRAAGWGWCVGQVVSLWPAVIGEASSLVSLALWVVHWRTIHRLTRLLGSSSPAAAE